MTAPALVIAALLVGQAAAAPADVTRELTRFEQQLAAAWQKGDCAAWAAMLASEWSVIHVTGEILTKADALKSCGTPAGQFESFQIDEIAVRSYGATAVVTGRTRIVTAGADRRTMALRFTDVFVRRAGRWQVVASHATRLGQ